MARSQSDSRRVAYHEAGHAVIGTMAGLSISSVTIVPSGDAEGMAVVSPTEATLNLETNLYFLLAGMACEIIATGRLETGGLGGDLGKVHQLLHPFFIDPDRWYPIQWVAQALLVKKTLTGD